MNDQDTIWNHSYAQAINEGRLIDVTVHAKEFGFRHPVALTRAVWDAVMQPSPGVAKLTEAETVRTVLRVLRDVALRGNVYAFQIRQRDTNGDLTPPVRLRAQCGPDDNGRECIIVMQWSEA
jgi:hypothetical protein